MLLKPLERMAVPTGLYIALPAGYEVQIRPRSGLALKHMEDFCSIPHHRCGL